MLSITNLEIAANLALKGAGIAILPACVAHNMGKNQLIRVKNSPVYSDQICLVYRHENRNIEAIQEIIRTIKKFVSE